MNDPIAFQTATLWPQLPDEVQVMCVPKGDETAFQCRARVAKWRAWLSTQAWAQEVLRLAIERATQAACAGRAQKDAEREAFRAARRAAGLTGPMSAARYGHLLGVWRRTGRLDA